MQVLEHRGDERGPPRLMACAQATPALAAEIFVEEDKIPPVRIVLIAAFLAMAKAPAFAVAQEERLL